MEYFEAIGNAGGRPIVVVDGALSKRPLASWEMGLSPKFFSSICMRAPHNAPRAPLSITHFWTNRDHLDGHCQLLGCRQGSLHS